MLGDAGALLGGEGGDGGQDAAQRHGYVVNVVHQANGFSRERHGFPRGASVFIVGREVGEGKEAGPTEYVLISVALSV